MGKRSYRGLRYGNQYISMKLVIIDVRLVVDKLLLEYSRSLQIYQREDVCRNCTTRVRARNSSRVVTGIVFRNHSQLAMDILLQV
jgi:hypothetical protein